MTMPQFQLVIEPQSNNEFRLTMMQCLYQNADLSAVPSTAQAGGQPQTKNERIETLWGLPLHFARQTIAALTNQTVCTTKFAKEEE